MPMNMLTKAVMVASLSVSTLTVLPTYAAISMDADEKAALVEKRLQHINEQGSMLLEKLSAHPFIEDVVYEHSELNHDKANQSASMSGELIFKVDEELMDVDAIEFTFDDQVDYSDAINEQDILARVTTSIALNEDSAAFSELDDEEQEAIANYFERIELQTDLLEGSTFKQYANLPEISIEDESGEFDFAGIKVEANYDDESFAQGVGDMHIEVGQLSITEMQETIDYDALMALPQEEQDNLAYEDYPMSEESVEAVNMQSFSLDYRLSEDGEMTLDSSPIAMAFNDNEGGLVIERITGEGKVNYDEAIAQYLGTQHFTAHNLSIESYDLPAPIVLEKLEYILSLDRADDDLYNMDAQIHVTPDAASFDVLTDGMFSIKSVDFGFNFANVSQEAIEQIVALNAHSAQVDIDLSGEDIELIKVLLKDLSNDGAKGGFDFNFSTDKGDATINATAHLREGADVDAWEEAIETEDSQAMQSLIESDLIYDAKLAVPITLLDAVGMTEMVQMMGAPYVIEEGDNLVVHAENMGDGPLINGISLEKLESGM